MKSDPRMPTSASSSAANPAVPATHVRYAVHGTHAVLLTHNSGRSFGKHRTEEHARSLTRSRHSPTLIAA